MERFQIRMMLESGGWRNEKDEWRRSMGITLNANPAVKWYFEHKCPECAELVRALVAGRLVTTDRDTSAHDASEIRKAEIYVLASVEDFVAYTSPEVIASSCDFVYAWDKSRLFRLADFEDKTVLDVGSGTGRLAFAAAEQAAWVYASEPVDSLREYMREKIAHDGIKNMRVVDGMADALPYPNDTFDIVMSGHVIGDDFEREVAEITRVCRHGGWLIDCPGDQGFSIKPNEELRKRGWEEFHYVGTLGFDVYCYRKQVLK